MVESWLLLSLVAIVVAIYSRPRNPLAIFPLVVTALVLDFRGGITSAAGVRYLLLIGIVVYLFRLRDKRGQVWGWPETLTLLLSGSAVIAAIYNFVSVRQVASSVLPTAVPLLLLLLPAPPRFISASRLESRMLALSGLVLAIGMALARTEGAGRAPLAAFNHEKVFLVVFAVLVGASLGHRTVALLTCLVLGASFVAYPAATMVIGVIVGVGTFWTVLRVKSQAGCFRLAALIGSGLLVALVSLTTVLAVFSGYFSIVGKTDNGSTRAFLYGEAVAKIAESPGWGSFFTGPVTVRAVLAGTVREVPFHNDYLTLAVGGGIGAPLCLIGIIAIANYRGAQFIFESNDERDRRLIASALASVNVASFSSLANPVLSNVTAATGFALLLFAVCTAPKAARSGPSAERKAQGRNEMKR